MHPLIYNLAVSAPNIINIACLFSGTVFKNPVALYFLIVSFIEHIINPIIKKIFRQSRPKGAMNCSSYINCSNKLSKSYGMPSGHSQSMGVFLGFWLFYMWDKHKGQSLSTLNLIGALCILITSIFVLYSRVVIGCHSVPQVVVGFIIGISIGVTAFKLYESKLKDIFETLVN
tara:strand:+ start:331 stop:849 length:519 start_codon:yes stop_codon:yes gene_type:complete